MFTANASVFISISDEAKERILIPGKVVEADENRFVARFDEAVSPDVGGQVEMFAEIRRKLFKQGSTVIAVQEAGPSPLIEFKPIGQPVSAEQRLTYRVSTAAIDILSRVGNEDRCRVADISPEGLAVVTRKEKEIGSLVDVAFTFEGQSFAAKALVRTVKNLPNGSYRYGLLIPENARQARQMVERLSAAAQRAQLRRLAGVA
jgi:hypothetical protein